jgi:hypothetical protein
MGHGSLRPPNFIDVRSDGTDPVDRDQERSSRERSSRDQDRDQDTDQDSDAPRSNGIFDQPDW